ncbi:MAG: hypothetical protein OXF20_07410 [Gammaproteobacteria bacterium]|nr:hypothetical protein [Gammaproteobacteria bacterium]
MTPCSSSSSMAERQAEYLGLPLGVSHFICRATVLASSVRASPSPAAFRRSRIIATCLAVKRLPKKVIDLKVFSSSSTGRFLNQCPGILMAPVKKARRFFQGPAGKRWKADSLFLSSGYESA